MEWYTISNIGQYDTPALLFYPERIQANIDLLIASIDDVQRLRVHVKTFKTLEIAQLMLNSGILKFKCATIAEAEMLAMAGAPDVLLAYQPVGPKMGRLAALVQAYPDTTFSCLVDNENTALALSAHFTADNPIGVYLDLNVGMDRTGILPDKTALDLYVKLRQMPGIVPLGLHAYDGHIHEQDLAKRTAITNKAYAPVAALAAALEAQGLPAPIIVAGGTPTFPIHAQRKGIECSPGTFVCWDAGYKKNFPEQPFQYAALLAGRVISVVNNAHITVDIGYKSVAAEKPLPRIYFLNAPDAVPVSQSEEHLVCTVNDAAQYPVGTVLYGVPQHICPTVADHDQGLVVAEHTITDTWAIIARNRCITL
ncbi:D-serine deaminase, pyridoxal phosphate-dependent [Chitinophaga costaii]|uniref:D-serine deaminase, pyridoxal phosphate-dependent n=1 Tax=Chitinophaga costaii TaxID=1335309 RepID=A0A1C4BSI1_9BACT|nr:D-TA family PLP-dependent enzyme [Chitinophaga costaii]PUZ27493.1 D-TA family PLP-dependent enzyme [Chitinophaga costaii]SCC09777.1 D-serine deaminase, pyridoxal phosphate-dependent [Chitinophaga costaii]